MSEGGGLTAAREELMLAARRLDAAGLNVSASGNLSVRIGPHVLVTPSGMPPAAMRPADTVLLDRRGAVVDGHRTPTSEWRLHLAVLSRRQDVSAVVHTHSPEATAAATLRRPLPAVHYVVARFGQDGLLPCAGYATYGSRELAGNVVTALGATGGACLMANHGALAVGDDLAGAVAVALDVEWFCGVYRRAVQVGSPVVLAGEEIARVSECFTTYGQPRDTD